MSINRFHGQGYATEPTLRATPSGTSVLNFSLALDERKKDKDGNWGDGPTTFLPCVSFGDSAERYYQRLEKGSPVCLEGHLRQRSWETDDGKRSTIECIIDKMFVAQKPEKSGSVKMGNKQMDIYEEDVPF